MEYFTRGIWRGYFLGVTVGTLFGAAFFAYVGEPVVAVIGFSFISGVMAMAFVAESIKAD